MLEYPADRVQAHDRQANHAAEDRPVVVRPGARMGECVSGHVRHNSHQNGADYQREPRRSAKNEFVEMIGQPALDRVRQKHRQRQLDEIMEEPKHDQGNWKSKKKDPQQRMPEVSTRGQAEKILEVWCEGADQHSRSHKAKTSKWESRRTMR
jgi:hypothetical protein